MMSRVHCIPGVLAIALLAFGCGGPQEKTLKDRVLEEDDDGASLVDSLVGDVDPVEEEDTDEEQPAEVADTPDVPDEDIIEGPQGAFLPTVLVQNEEVDATFTVKTAEASPEIVVEDAAAGSEVRLDPGLCHIEFETDAVAGSPTLTLRDVEIPSGRRIRREVKYKVGQITLVTGGRCVKKPIRIRPTGATDWLPGKFKTCVPIVLQAGNYEAQMGAGKRGIPISGIQVYDGGIREILIRKQ